MPLSKQKKEKIINELTDKLSRMKMAIFVDYRGISTNEMQKLKNALKKENSELKVAKKTLLGIALKKSGLKEVNIDNINTPIATVFSFDDEVKPSKIVFQFAQEQTKLKILGGIFENKMINEEMIKTLALLPTKEQLLTKLVGSLSSPIYGLVSVLQANIKNLIYVLSEIKK